MPAPRAPGAPARESIRLRGVVQGVGMRPFVFGLARRYGLAGFVRNAADALEIEVEGARIGEFAQALRAEAPPLARIGTMERSPVDPTGERGFAIAPSHGTAGAVRIPADAATCPACRADLFDPASRFYLYPFVTCPSCGPRYTITQGQPFDRGQTAMAGFTPCPACARDYHDPANRRFHAETIACPTCGPRLSHPVAAIAAALAGGRIVALKGLGGFHLMCDAADARAVTELRRRKGRDSKPFAVMAAGPDAIRAVAGPSGAELALAGRSDGPIVLMPARRGSLAPAVAPGLAEIGVMLPYAPVHHLAFAAGAPAVLVATSANLSGEPLVIDDAEAAARLSGIADLIVGHDRPIIARADDSVMRVIDGAPAIIRRGRGAVPEPIDLGTDGPSVLGVGGQLKAAVTLTRGREAFVSPHVGDLDTPGAVRFYLETIDRLRTMLGVVPDLVVCDLHPDYRSTRVAESLGRPLLRVQHHAAHVAAVAAERHLSGPVLGVALDGHGLGDDGTAWGGEMLIVEGARWRRIGHLAPLALPGGDRAAREPWRMGVAALHALGRGAEAAARFPGCALAGAVAAGLDRAPVTTSLGRLFDAAAALLGLRTHQDHEAQAAMELEALVSAPADLPGGFCVVGGVLSFNGLLAALAETGRDAADGANLLHGTVAAGVAAWITEAARAAGMNRVALGGGCLINRALAEGVAERLRAAGIEPLFARAVPCNDGGLSFGQAALGRAAAQAKGDG